MWVRGLKLLDFKTSITRHVAPYVGAWIETQRPHGTSLKRGSHPMWVRGLKPIDTYIDMQITLVAPYVGAWIETAENIVPCGRCASHPMWVRGLKHE